MRSVLFASVVALSLAATQALALGANSDKNLKRATADTVTQDTKTLTSPDSITLTDVQRGAFRIRWQANTPNGPYACTADDMMRQFSCTKLTTVATK